MTLLLSCQAIGKSFGTRKLFDSITFGIFKKDRIGLIGPNGSGKSTLVKILVGLDQPSEGSVIKSRTLKIGYVQQETHYSQESIFAVVMKSLEDIQGKDWDQKSVDTTIILSQMGFTDPSIDASTLSGGWKKRLAIAAELVKDPDLVLLDEPTNHLDLEGVMWLEEFLKKANFAFIVVTHDRDFLENVANKIIEVNASYPKNLFVSEGSYSTFLEKKEAFLDGQVQQEKSLNSKVKRELEWLKQNPKARTTKSRSRIQEAYRLSGELSELKDRNKTEKSQLDFDTTQRETKKLLVATNIAKSIGGKPLFSGINFTLSPGTRLGILGVNGSGKTTLLKLLLGEINPDKGTLKFAEGIKIVYFDQQRASVPAEATLREALAPEGENVIYRGRSIHVNSWCKKFLFTPDRLDLPFKQLSGGEKARVHLARLMLQPADILLLDEPTNDLDIPTLEILEESLESFPGAIVMISHDRYMLDQISNAYIGLGTGLETQIFADFQQWSQALKGKTQPKVELKKVDKVKARPQETRKKMSYMEKREWEQMEEKILALENDIRELEQKSQANNELAVTNTIYESLEQKHRQMELLYHRWEELERKAKDE